MAQNEYRTYTIALAENTQDEELYDLKLTRQPNVDKLLGYMEDDRWELVSMTADSGWLTATFSRRHS
jgi:hypothetical protein